MNIGIFGANDRVAIFVAGGGRKQQLRSAIDEVLLIAHDAQNTLGQM